MWNSAEWTSSTSLRGDRKFACEESEVQNHSQWIEAAGTISGISKAQMRNFNGANPIRLAGESS